MTEQQIEARLKVLEQMHAKETHSSTLATINRCYEKLLMMLPEPEDAHENAERK